MAVVGLKLTEQLSAIAWEVNPTRTKNNLWFEALGLCCTFTRAERGMATSELARRMNVSERAILDFEHGAGPSPGTFCEELELVAKVLGFDTVKGLFEAADKLLPDTLENIESEIAGISAEDD